MSKKIFFNNNKNISPRISKDLFKKFQDIPVYEFEGEKFIKVQDFIDVCRGVKNVWNYWGDFN